MKKLSIEQVMEKYLDNADLKIRITNNMQFIALDFFVFGKIEGEFWRVAFECKKVINLQVTKEVYNDESQDACFLVLNTEVKNVNINSLNLDVHNFCSGVDSVWEISIFGSININIICVDFKWDIVNLNYEEYSRLLRHTQN